MTWQEFKDGVDPRALEDYDMDIEVSEGDDGAITID